MKGRTIIALLLSVGALLVAAGCSSDGTKSTTVGDRQTVGGPGDPGYVSINGGNR